MEKAKTKMCIRDRIQADIVEDGKTFEENAIIKAEAIRKMTN